jgi:hypothetical protein
LFFEGTKNICCKQTNKRTPLKKKKWTHKQAHWCRSSRNRESTNNDKANNQPKTKKNSTQNKTTITNIALYVNKTTALRAAPQAFNMWPCKNIGGVFQWIHWIYYCCTSSKIFSAGPHIEHWWSFSNKSQAAGRQKTLLPLTHIPASPYAALAGATREFNELITPATRANANLRVVTTPPVTTPVSSSSTSTLEARKLINPTRAPTPRAEETGITTDLPPVIPALLDDTKPAPVTPLPPELWNTRRLLDTIAAMLCWFCWLGFFFLLVSLLSSLLSLYSLAIRRRS